MLRREARRQAQEDVLAEADLWDPGAADDPWWDCWGPP
jgi:hypothetical protein